MNLMLILLREIGQYTFAKKRWNLNLINEPLMPQEQL